MHDVYMKPNEVFLSVACNPKLSDEEDFFFIYISWNSPFLQHSTSFLSI